MCFSPPPFCCCEQVELHKDRATFVHLYGAEPHPTIPYTNFDSGRMIPNYWSTVSQPASYDGRLDMVARIQGVTHPDEVCV